MPPGYIDGYLAFITDTLTSPTVLTPTVTSGSWYRGNFTQPNISSGTWYQGTLTQPIISSGNWASAALTQPSITSATLTQPVITTGSLTSPAIAMTGGTFDGGILNNTILGARVFKTAVTGTAKTLDFSTADIYLVQLTCSTVLTVSNVSPGKTYQLIVQQDIANSYTAVSYPSSFINGFVDSGITQRTGAIDFWTVTFDGSRHYAVGVKDIQ